MKEYVQIAPKMDLLKKDPSPLHNYLRVQKFLADGSIVDDQGR
jgi:hypothetical protein